MNRKILALLTALASVAGCDLASKTDREGPIAQCKPAGPTQAACLQNSDCCSYACLNGVCAAGEALGALCSTTNDCGSYFDPVTYAGGQMLCKAGGCAYPVPYCRDVADVCSADAQCCGGNRCTTGRCTLNRPPVVDLGPSPVNDVPRRRLYTLTNNTSDPDGDALVYGWTLTAKPLGSAAVLSSPTVRNPTFTPDLEGMYVFGFVATDLPAPSMSASGTVVINVVNTPPTVTPQADVADWRRNNHAPAQISAVVNDPDGDDITCTWVVKDPSAAVRSTVGPTACYGNAGIPDNVTTTVPFPPNLLPADEGVWTITISATDGNSTTASDVHVTVTNDAPVPAVTRPSGYYANLDAPAGSAAITLDASVSTDPNGDHLLIPGLAYFWEWVSVSDGGAFPTLTNPGTATPSFTATRAADYILRVTVTDQPNLVRVGYDSAPLLVSVKVGRYIRPLAHDVIASGYAKTANKLVMAGHDPSNAAHGMIWVFDAAAETEGTGILLVDTGITPNVYGVPKFLGVTPDGTKAVVVDDNALARSIWFVNNLSTTPTVTRVTSPYPNVVDLVVATNRWAYLFSSTWDFTLGAFKEIDLNTNSVATAPWSGGPSYGAASSSGTNNYIYKVDTGTGGGWAKYAIGNNGSSNTMLAWDFSGPSCGGYPASMATEIWPILGDTRVIGSCGAVYGAADLVQSGTLGISPDHVDSTSSQALVVSASTITLFNATLVKTGTDTVPAWGDNYYGRTAWISTAWFNSTGTKRFALVDDTASPKRYGLVVFP